MKYNVYLDVNDGNGRSEILKGAVSFRKKSGDYGNGYLMRADGLGEPFNFGVYDIRYDKTFREGNELSYIVQHYANKYDGVNGAWKLVGIRVHEAVDE